MKKKIWPQWPQAVLLAAVLFYYEILFRLSTVGGVFKLGTAFMLLFCIAYGSVGSLLLSLLPGGKGKRIGTGLVLFLSALPFLIEYFVYRKFKILYDLTTVFAGASDALGSYSHEIYAMIFSWGGILRIVLYLLPTVLFVIFRKRIVPEGKVGWASRCLTLGLAVLTFGGSLLGVYLTPSQYTMWRTQYHFETAAGNFGLITGVGLDLRELCFGSSVALTPDTTMPPVEETTSAPETSEETHARAETEAATETTTEPTEPVIEYGLNQLDIDFASLEAGERIAGLNAYVASQAASSQHQYTGLFKGKNLIFITAEAFALEVIDPELTPTLYRLASKGMQFTDYYQMSGAGTTGGEYQNVFGMVPTDGGGSFKATAENDNYFTMGSMLDRLGYYGQAFHNNSYTYYDRHKTHINIGYSAGFMGYGNGMEAYVSSQWPQSDLEMFAGTIPLYIDKQPFNIYYMTVSGHGTYSTGGNAMAKKNWDRVADLEYSDLVKGYLASQLELENALACLVEQLEAHGIADDTVICLTADHFPYGLDDDAPLGSLPYLSELYGYDVDTVFQRDHSSWILWCGSLEAEEPIVVDSPTCSLDILPTLANLFGVEFDSRLFVGRDVLADTQALVFNASYDWMTEYGVYYTSTGAFTQTDDSVTLPEGYVDSICAIVRNKVAYCDAVLENDYFRYVHQQLSAE